MRTLKLVLCGLALFPLCFQAPAQTLEPLWSLTPGSRPYLTTDNTQRGMAVNPATGHLLVVNRAGSLSVNVVDALTGANGGTLDVTGITGGTFALNMIGVGSDGAIYGCNLTTDAQGATSPFKIYRWANETSAPTLVYSGDPSLGNTTAANRRFGDTLEVRGSGNAVQILAASRSGTIASLFTTPDGSTYTPAVINTDAVAGDLGLGLAFGAGDTFWATAAGRVLRQLNLTTGATLNYYGTNVIPSAVSCIGVDPTSGLLAGLSLNTTPVVDSLNLYRIPSLSTSISNAPLDVENFSVDNANLNGTGDVAFWNGKVYALDSNNGLIAFTVVPEPAMFTLLAVGALAFVLRRRNR